MRRPKKQPPRGSIERIEMDIGKATKMMRRLVDTAFKTSKKMKQCSVAIRTLEKRLAIAKTKAPSRRKGAAIRGIEFNEDEG